MKFETALCLALAFVATDCASGTNARTLISDEHKPDIYLHLVASYQYPKPPQVIASVPVSFYTNFDVLVYDRYHLTGRVEPRGAKYFVHFQIYLYDGTNYYDGEVDLDKPDDPGTRPYNDKTPFIYQPMFILSRNQSATEFLEQHAAITEDCWRRQNPLTLPQITRAEQRFRLLRSGMTENDILRLLGLFGDRKRLHDPRIFRSNDWNTDCYQLEAGENLCLEVDCPAWKIRSVKHGDGTTAWFFDHGAYGDDHSNCFVVHASLGPQMWSKDTGYETTNRSW